MIVGIGELPQVLSDLGHPGFDGVYQRVYLVGIPEQSGLAQFLTPI